MIGGQGLHHGFMNLFTFDLGSTFAYQELHFFITQLSSCDVLSQGSSNYNLLVFIIFLGGGIKITLCCIVLCQHDTS